MNKEFWDKFYSQFSEERPSPFAEWFVEQGLSGTLIELGSGNGRDLRLLERFFKAKGIDQSYSGENITKIKIEDYIKTHKCPDIVYTRFVWHAIDNEVQEEIIKWCKSILVIEARTDKGTYTGHKRNLVNVEKLKEQLKDFNLLYCEENIGWAKYGEEDPPVVRIIAQYAKI